ncbi:hypothetical protein H6501_00600 [Candidatus Woesearchaeota archaeon]|nr:hypothetical protein [Nanoarchaeota archaeon]MCB9370079.1 hypothetical protein [Candidatus Woesearchaeota archaeon]USN44610.1 MAG: hypothetical protein H6500_02075 [Candidatus Woesearchaeota archaeon]
MAKVVVKSKVKKVKRKFPVELKAPEYLNSMSLGTSNVTDLPSLVGKCVRMNLMYVTGSVKNQNVRLVFTVTEAASGLAKTHVTEYEQIAYFLSRFVKKGSELLEDSFVVTSKDGVGIRVKPFVVTKGTASTLVKSALRAKARELVEKDASSKTIGEFMSSVIVGKGQNEYRNELKKIFPLKSFEFRKVSVEK